MLKSFVSLTLDMRLDILAEVDLGPGREKKYLILWPEVGLFWVSEHAFHAFEQLFVAWKQPKQRLQLPPCKSMCDN